MVRRWRTEMKASTEKNVIRALCMVDLVEKVYKAEGWTRVAGESKIARMKTKYDLRLNYASNRFTATRKEGV